MSEIRINRNEWHARVYQWWYQRKYGHEPSTYSNLCPYMRAVLFWSWMRWLFIDGQFKRLKVPVVAWMFLAVEVPRWAGILSFRLKIALLICYAIVAGTAALIAFCYGMGRLFHGRRLPPPPEFKAIKRFAGLVKAYSETAHSRICPEIKLVRNDGNYD